MRSIKALIVSAAFGFLLSFVFGLFSHAAILIVLIRALIIAAVFAGLGFGISLVSDKFLFDDSDSSDISVDSTPVSNPSVGSKVDLFVHDEELSPGDSENNYYVDDNSKQMLNASDMKSSKAPVFNQPQVSAAEDVAAPAAAAQAAAGGMPAIDADSAGDGGVSQAGREAPSPSAASAEGEKVGDARAAEAGPSASPSQPDAAQTSGAEGLDTLPDMSSFVMENSSSSSEEEANDSSVESDSHFVTTVSHSSGSGDAGIQDAAVMAKAISSVLSSEDS